MRIDLLLCRLRLAKTRSAAQRMIGDSHLRCNGAHVLRPSHCVRPGDVLTFASGDAVRILQVVALPDRRGPAPEAQAHYRTLDRHGHLAIASADTTSLKDHGT